MFIWDIHFTGNETRTDEALSSFLREKGVFAGMLKKEADCRKIVKEIRTQYDDVVWVSASLDGSRLKIQIKENEDSFEKEEKKKDENAVDLVASSDGVITKIVTRTGTPQVHVGDTVKKGDTFESAFMYFGVGPQELFENNKSLYQVVLPEGLELVVD